VRARRHRIVKIILVSGSISKQCRVAGLRTRGRLFTRTGISFRRVALVSARWSRTIRAKTFRIRIHHPFIWRTRMIPSTSIHQLFRKAIEIWTYWNRRSLNRSSASACGRSCRVGRAGSLHRRRGSKKRRKLHFFRLKSSAMGKIRESRISNWPLPLNAPLRLPD